MILIPSKAKLLVHEVQIIDTNGRSRTVDAVKEQMIGQNSQLEIDLSNFGIVSAINLRLESYGGHADLDLTTLSEESTNLNLRRPVPLK